MRYHGLTTGGKLWGGPMGCRTTLFTQKLITLLVLFFLSNFAVAGTPISLAGPNGQGLIWRKLDIKMAINGPLCLTQMEMIFENPHDRRVEGTFACELPVGATVSRFAKDVFGKMMEGEVVERKKAVKVYTEILHTPRDPALMEQDQGNRFSTRIWPIERNAKTKLILTYSQVVPLGEGGRREFRVPLAGLPVIDDFSLSAVCRPLPGATVSANTSWFGLKLFPKGPRVIIEQPQKKKKFQPKRDFTVLVEPTADSHKAVRVLVGNYEMVVFQPDLPRRLASDECHRGWSIYFDTSASMAAASEYRLSVLQKVIEGIRDRFQKASFKLCTFDLKSSFLLRTTANQLSMQSLFRKLRQRGFYGATDLSRLLRSVGNEARACIKPRSFLLFTDGIPTIGLRDTKVLLEKLGDWPKRHKLHLIVTGTTEDEKVTRAISRKTGARVIRLPRRVDGSSRADLALSKILSPIGPTIRLTDAGAKWIRPTVFRDVQPNQELIAFAKMETGKKPLLKMTMGSGRVAPIHCCLQVSRKFGPLIEREAWHAYLKSLEKEIDEEQERKKRLKLTAEMLNISQERRVLCPLTSMLVLETEWDYDRYNIKRQSLADILAVGKNGVKLIHRRNHRGVVSEYEPEKTIEPESGELLLPPLPTTPRRSLDHWGAPSMQWLTQSGRKRLSKKELELYRQHARGGLKSKEMHDAYRHWQKIGSDGRARDQGSYGMLLQRLYRVRERRASEQMSFNDRLMQIVGEEVEAPLSRKARVGELVHEDSSNTNSQLTIERTPRPVTRSQSGVFGDEFRAFDGGAIHSPRVRIDTELFCAQIKISKQPLEKREIGLLYKSASVVSGSLAGISAFARRCIDSGKWKLAEKTVISWLRKRPYEPSLYEYLGLAYKGWGKESKAVRVLSSIAEVSPNSATLLDYAGYHMLNIGAYIEAEQFFRAAIYRRPDHHNPYRGLALALWFLGRYEEAARVLEAALQKNFHFRYANVKEMIRKDLANLYFAWIRYDKGNAKVLSRRAKQHSVQMDNQTRLRIRIHWDADASDLDLFVFSERGEIYPTWRNDGQAFFIVNSVSQGLGPEEIELSKDINVKGLYHIGVNRRQGPMGTIRGVLTLIEPSTKGKPIVHFSFFDLHRKDEGKALYLKSLEIDWKN